MFMMKHSPTTRLLTGMAAMLIVAGCSSSDDDDDNPVTDNTPDPVEDTTDDTAGDIAGGVFVMSNIIDANTIVAYQRADDGTLTLAGEFPTGGQGGDFDGGEGLDPLISAYALINTPDNEYLMAVNAGSDTISVLQINDDMTLAVVDTESTNGTGPNLSLIHISEPTRPY